MIPDLLPPATSKVIYVVPGMVLIPAGEFMMGANNGDEDQKPAHKVRVSAFYMDTHEVSQKIYESFMEKNPSKFKAPDKPVEQVDWYHAALYCNMRSLKEGLKPCYDAKTLACDFAADGYRLPTEAEWEYACRAGTTTPRPWGLSNALLDASSTWLNNAEGRTSPVIARIPNAFGCFDMLGNLSELCLDAYGPYGSSLSEPYNLPAASKAASAVILWSTRGGSYVSSGNSLRSSMRSNYPDTAVLTTTIRLARTMIFRNP